MSNPGPIAVIGAGVIGSAVAYALAREGRKVLLLDRAAPGIAGASFGSVGHIATELVEPLPSPGLLFGFWRELTALDGPLEISLSRLPSMFPWVARFAAAAFRREENTQHLAPLVKASLSTLEHWLSEMGRADLLRRNGHYEIWLKAGAAERAKAQARAMEHLGVPTELAPREVVDAVAGSARSARANSASTARSAEQSAATGLWFPASGHVADPLEIVRAFAGAAAARGADIRTANVLALEVSGDELRVATDAPSAFQVAAAVICTGAWSRQLLRPFGLKIPMQAARGYHVEMPGHAALVDAPILYADQRILVIPLAGRLRTSTYMEFASPDAPSDPRKPRRLREKVRDLGYDCPLDGPSWVGPRPVLPDYLPGIGRVQGGPNVFYAIGHQHIGLTLAAVTGDLVADLVAGREPRHNVSAFDLRRFGSDKDRAQ
jgi:D-hydroxyproline dehydrogenase